MLPFSGDIVVPDAPGVAPPGHLPCRTKLSRINLPYYAGNKKNAGEFSPAFWPRQSDFYFLSGHAQEADQLAIARFIAVEEQLVSVALDHVELTVLQANLDVQAAYIVVHAQDRADVLVDEIAESGARAHIRAPR